MILSFLIVLLNSWVEVFNMFFKKQKGLEMAMAKIGNVNDFCFDLFCGLRDVVAVVCCRLLLRGCVRSSISRAGN